MPPRENLTAKKNNRDEVRDRLRRRAHEYQDDRVRSRLVGAGAIPPAIICARRMNVRNAGQAVMIVYVLVSPGEDEPFRMRVRQPRTPHIDPN